MKLIVFCWLVLLSIPLGWALSFHHAPHKFSSIRDLKSRGGWQIFHVLGGECRCSQRVLTHLLNRKKLNFVHEETIFLIGTSNVSDQAIVAAGYRLIRLEEDEAREDYGIKNSPFLTIIKDDEIQYEGAYARNQMHAESFDDEAITRSLQNGEKPVEYPVFGCANGRDVKKVLDPWGFKYDVK